jgi:hypothetical protein
MVLYVDARQLPIGRTSKNRFGNREPDSQASTDCGAVVGHELAVGDRGACLACEAVVSKGTW